MKIAAERISNTPAANPLFVPTSAPFPAEKLPVPVYDDEPGLVELWHDAWRIAWQHVYESAATPFSPYLGEGCGTNKVWIWDSCFMALWGCYAHQEYPVANTLDNLYAIMDGADCGITIHHPDNPPLLGWAELELYRHTGDVERIRRLLARGVLQKYYWWREQSAAPGDFLVWGDSAPVMLRHLEHGYLWSGCPSGMDNTPRGRGNYQYLLWVDALAQQGMFARDIAALCEIAGDSAEARHYRNEHENKKILISQYFDEKDGCFYDRTLSRPGYGDFVRVLTPASFWPVFAEMTTARQNQGMIDALLDPNRLGGAVACPSVSRSDPDFDADGGYWRGGVWLPTFYMVMKALEKTGERDLARKLSVDLLRWMKTCFDEVEPHTIWECYSPAEPMPSTTKNGLFCRRDFCGWSALGPISLFIENVIGIHSVDAATRTVHWHLPKPQRGVVGIRNFRFGDVVADLLYDGRSISLQSNQHLNVVTD